MQDIKINVHNNLLRISILILIQLAVFQRSEAQILRAKVVISDIEHVYDGDPKIVTVTTTPADLTVVITYDNAATPPTNAGSYNVIATVVDNWYFGQDEKTMVISKADANIQLGNLFHNYDGTPKSVAVQTDPAGLLTTTTYNGSTAIPVNPGTYRVVSTIVDDNYQGVAEDEMIINSPPIANGIDDVVVNEDAPNYQIDLYKAFEDLEDADKDLDFDVTQSFNPGLLTPSISGNLLILNFTANQFGESEIKVKATDTDGASTETLFSIEVISVNDAPDFSAPAIEAVNEDTGNKTINAWASFDPGPDNESNQSVLEYQLEMQEGADLFANIPSVNTNGNLSFGPAAEKFGSAKFSLRVVDNGGIENGGINTSSAKEYTIKINSVNDKPSFTASNPPAILEGAGAQVISGWASFYSGADNENQTATYTVLNVSNPNLFQALPKVNGNGELSYRAKNNLYGSSTFDVYVKDNGGTANGGIHQSDTQSFTITVNGINDQPSFTASNPPTINEDSGPQEIVNWATFNPGIGESEQTATYIISDVTTDFFSTSPSVNSEGTLRYTVAANVFGSTTFNVAVKDNGGTANGGIDQSEFKSFTITVNPVNDAPSFTASNPPAVNEDAGTQTISGWATFSLGPENESGQTGNFEVTNITNPSLFETAPSVNNSGTLAYKGAANISGTSSFDVQLFDNGGTANGGVNQSSKKTFSITINAVNDAPVFDSEPVIAATEDQQYIYNISYSDKETPSDELILSASELPVWLSLTDNGGSASLSGIPLNAHVGQNSVTLNLSDGDKSTIQSFNITVENTNDPPVFTSNPVTKAVVDDLYTYNIISSDMDGGDVLTLNAVEYPDWLTFENSGNGIGKLSGVPGSQILNQEFSVELQVKDQSNGSDTQIFTIKIVNDNTPPAFTSTPATEAEEGVEYIYNITIFDPDEDDQIIITASKKPSWLTLIDNGDGTAVLSGIPGNPDIGSHDVLLKVSDGVSNDTQLAEIVVSNANDPPQFTSTPITSVLEDEVYSYQILTEDPDPNDSWDISLLTVLPDWLTFTNNNNGTGKIEGVAGDQDIGSYQIEIKAEDAAGDSSVQAFTLEVTNINDEPEFLSEPSTEATINEFYSYQIEVSDDDTDSELSIIGTEVPNWLNLTDNGNGTGILQGTPSESDAGSYNIILTVRDDQNAEAIQDFILVVNNPPVVQDFQKNIDEDQLAQFILSDFTASFSDVNGQSLTKIKITEMPQNGSLRLNSVVLSTGTEILAGEIANLIYVPEENFYGDDQFSWVASDGVSYATDAAAVSIFVNPVNDAPVLSGFDEQPVDYIPGKDKRLFIMESLMVTDVDDEELTNAQIFFNTRTYEEQNDKLYLEDIATDNISGSFNEETGTFILNGVDTKENYERVLRTLQYAFEGDKITEFEDRIINIFVDDGSESSQLARRNISLIRLDDILIPSGITPNDDGANDTWILDNIESYPDSEVRVFTRSGTEVFYSLGYQEPWDGTLNGKLLPIGTYFYIIKLNELEQKTGTVTIIR